MRDDLSDFSIASDLMCSFYDSECFLGSVGDYYVFSVLLSSTGVIILFFALFHCLAFSFHDGFVCRIFRFTSIRAGPFLARGFYSFIANIFSFFEDGWSARNYACYNTARRDYWGVWSFRGSVPFFF